MLIYKSMLVAYVQNNECYCYDKHYYPLHMLVSLFRFIHDNAALYSSHQSGQQLYFVSDQAQSRENPVVRSRTLAMSSAQAETYKIMRCKPKNGLINRTQHDQNSSAITYVCNESASNHSEKATEQYITTPIPVSSYTEKVCKYATIHN